MPNEIPDPNYGVIVPASGVATFSRDDLMALVKEQYKARYYRPEWVEIELVSYTEAAGLQNAPATPLPPTPTPPPTGETVTPRPEATRRPLSIDRLSWLVIVPTEFGYDRCFGGPIRSDTRSICFFAADWMLIDALTGEIVPVGGSIGLPSPQVTSDEYRALERFAWAEGWWELWHQVKQYSGERLPAGLATQLDRPDALRPTPYPTSTPDPDATPRPTPTPAPTPTPHPAFFPVPFPVPPGPPTPTPTPTLSQDQTRPTSTPVATSLPSLYEDSANLAAYPNVTTVLIGTVTEHLGEEVWSDGSYGLWRVEVERYLVNPLSYDKVVVRLNQPPGLAPGQAGIFFLTNEYVPNRPWDPNQTDLVVVPGPIPLLQIYDGQVHTYRYGESSWEPLEDFVQRVIDVAAEAGRPTG